MISSTEMEQEDPQVDDPRLGWLRDRIFSALDIDNMEVFEEMLDRDGGKAETTLSNFLNESPEFGNGGILFYKTTEEVDVQVEVETGKLINYWSRGWHSQNKVKFKVIFNYFKFNFSWVKIREIFRGFNLTLVTEGRNLYLNG